jgi:hypothetical protein
MTSVTRWPSFDSRHAPYPDPALLGPQIRTEAELDQAALPLNTFAENSRLYSPGMVRLTPLMMVETGLLSFSNCLLRAIRRIPPAHCRRSASSNSSD